MNPCMVLTKKEEKTETLQFKYTMLFYIFFNFNTYFFTMNALIVIVVIVLFLRYAVGSAVTEIVVDLGY